MKDHNFGYDVKYASKHYHVVQNRRNGQHSECSMMLLPNRSTTSESHLPRVKMNLQTNRPPNLAQAHDARFEVIDKNPSMLTTHRRVPTLNFSKQHRLACHQHLINESSHNLMQRYSPNESLVTKRASIGVLDINK